MRFKFKTEELKSLIAHAAAAPDHSMPYGFKKSETKTGMFLVHDDGVYLMSNGTPNLMADGTLAAEGQEGSRMVVYAAGHGKGTFLGGDDYVEFFELDIFEEAVREGHTSIIFNVTANSIKVVYELKREPITMVHIQRQISKWLAEARERSSILVKQSPRHKKLALYPVDKRAAVLRKYPNAAILNDMDFSVACAIYAKMMGVAA